MMKLIDEWKQAWRWFSVQANLLSVSMTGAYLALPEKMQDVLPSKYVLGAAALITVLGTIGRLVKQTPAEGDPK